MEQDSPQWGLVLADISLGCATCGPDLVVFFCGLQLVMTFVGSGALRCSPVSGTACDQAVATS